MKKDKKTNKKLSGLAGLRAESEESEALCTDGGDEWVAVRALGLAGSLDVGGLGVDINWGVSGSWLGGGHVELSSSVGLRGKDEEGAVGSVGEHFDCCRRVSVVF